MHTSSHTRFSQLTATALLAGLVTASLPASAQTFPDRPIRIVAPAAAGGNLDIVARIVAEGMGRDLGQRVIVDNQAGGRQIPGTLMVAKAKPDGYTLLTGGVSFTVNAALYDDLPYHAAKDFVAVGMIGASPLVVIAHPSLPANNIKELIALAKSKPGVINYASTGIGSPAHIAGELLASMAGIKITHVSYKATQQANIDTMTGQMHFFFPSASSVVGLIKVGKLKALGMGSLKRSPQLPGIPAISETLPGFDVSPWNGIMAPAATPGAVITRLNAALNRGMTMPEVKEGLIAAGLDVHPLTPDETAAFINGEIKRFAKLTKEAGIKGER